MDQFFLERPCSGPFAVQTFRFGPGNSDRLLPYCLAFPLFLVCQVPALPDSGLTRPTAAIHLALSISSRSAQISQQVVSVLRHPEIHRSSVVSLTYRPLLTRRSSPNRLTFSRDQFLKFLCFDQQPSVDQRIALVCPIHLSCSVTGQSDPVEAVLPGSSWVVSDRSRWKPSHSSFGVPWIRRQVAFRDQPGRHSFPVRSRRVSVPGVGFVPPVAVRHPFSKRVLIREF